LLLVSNESFTNAEQDIKVLTGVKISHSTQHRLINNYHPVFYYHMDYDDNFSQAGNSIFDILEREIQLSYDLKIQTYEIRKKVKKKENSL